MGWICKKNTSPSGSADKASKKTSPKFDKNDGWHTTVDEFDAFHANLYGSGQESDNQ